LPTCDPHSVRNHHEGDWPTATSRPLSGLEWGDPRWSHLDLTIVSDGEVPDAALNMKSAFVNL
jgi:hypothetical protein